MVHRVDKLFIPDIPSPDALILTYLETDEYGLKMSGDFPHLWDSGAEPCSGPALYGEDDGYVVMRADYQKHHIWLCKMTPEQQADQESRTIS